MRGEALMPTTVQKARLLLKNGKARIHSHRPFTIQLTYATGEAKQDLVLGVDAGYHNIGISVVSPTNEVFSSEIKLLQGQVERNKERRMYRTQRRSRLRYRKPRFDNRIKPKGWLAPSIQHKFDSHIKFIKRLCSVLPITKTIIEIAAFDIQKIKAPEINGKQYQEGEQLGFWNLREYILHRDNHKCQNPNCKNKSKNQILEIHHIGFWKKDRSDRPGNLITLCDKCHTPAKHKKKGFLYGWEAKTKSFKPETFMSIVRWKLVDELKCAHTYGHITKHKRIGLSLPKTHYHDAFCIAGGENQERCKPIFFHQKRKNNRCLEKFYDAKIIDTRTGKKVSGGELHSGRRTRNKNLNGENLRKYRGVKVSKGRRQIRKQRYAIRPDDIVKFDGKIYRAIGVQNKGQYLKIVNGSKPIVKNIKYIEVLFHQKTLKTV
ncbi:HNH endonuclease [Desulfobacter latus]|uniref:HNH endonuclease n=2 Tax=Desulfobacter latus TaxID=2292 RepID=A0A850T8D8_9BACT|nr:HNH endonuclease [Desulfobacter latus]